MLRDSAYSLASTTLRLLTNLALFLVLAAAWGPERFGLFMYPFTVAAIVVKVVDYGFALQLARDLGRRPGQEHVVLGIALGAKLALVAPAVLLAVAVGALLPWGEGGPLLLAVLLGDAILQSFVLLLQVPLRAVGRFDAESRTAFTGNGLVLASVLGCVLAGGGPLPVAIAFLGARSIQLGIAWRACRLALAAPPVPAFARPEMVAVLRSGLPFGAHAAIGTLNMHVDTLLLQHWLGAEGVGLYQAGMRIVLGALLAADALNNVFLARLAREAPDSAEFRQLGARMTRTLTGVGVLAFAVTVGAAEPIVDVLFPDSYAPLVALLPALGLLMLIRYVGAAYGTFLTLGDRQGARVAGVVLTLVATIALNAFLVPRFGLHGAVGAAILGHLLLYSFYAVAARVDRGTVFLEDRTRALLVGAAILGTIALLPGATSATVHVALAIGMVALALGLGATVEEWRTLAQRRAGLT